LAIIVQKYGGTSVGTVEKMRAIAKKVLIEYEKGNQMVIVVSAMGKTTDTLVKLAREVSDNPNKRDLDLVMSTGEQISIGLLSMVFHEMNYNAVALTGFQAGIKTKGIHTKNKIIDIETEKIKRHLNNNKIVIVAGFQGINEEGDITTLGRGGSDTTAVALAAKLNCCCEIYTDVDGIYTVDPRLFPTAKKLDVISYEEMMEMASLGAGVMETRAVELGCKFGVPIYVASSHGTEKGTLIKEYDDTMEGKVITGLSVSDDVLMVTINNVKTGMKNISNIFDILAREHVNVDMISQTAPNAGRVNVSFTASKGDIRAIKKMSKEIKESMDQVEVQTDENIAKISVVGIGMNNHSGVASSVFNVLSKNDIEFKQVTTSEISISLTIESQHKLAAVSAIAKEFNL
jgi:aspartate kinase